jgi:hypothetical protein
LALVGGSASALKGEGEGEEGEENGVGRTVQAERKTEMEEMRERARGRRNLSDPRAPSHALASCPRCWTSRSRGAR